ncbi:hypothetical protein CYMTET_20501 [Cymbomonas tetramitiformis]|uniref:3-hydroxyisobutyrate dehydrogenase n=1 Tax=Cymbomonas tetramitiformis TaxID=36881 RepID=A0AAE0L472_9CHLO|nr:hypothetical protein CYMTET_20501 [Cymbomonas tetramitiformis]
MSVVRPKEVAFIGLGAMGYPMAGNLAKTVGKSLLVWNRSHEKATKHASEHGSTSVQNIEETCQAKVIFTCLPSSREFEELIFQIQDGLVPGTIIVDCTSGEPVATQRIAKALLERGTQLLDCPVSGGPGGAKAATLTAMLGGDPQAVLQVTPTVALFAKKIIHVGPVGSGHAIKAVNNILNVTHLMLASEGLLALKKMGVDPAKALETINNASGRSLQTEQRIPNCVLTRSFDYGFKLGLMNKDVGIAGRLLEEYFPEAVLLKAAQQLMLQAVETQGSDVDYTEVVKALEAKAGTQLVPNPRSRL